MPTPSTEIFHQPAFRVSLQAKLNLIIWAAGGAKPAARKYGFAYPSFARWRAGGSISWPQMQKVDEAYDIAWEKCLVHKDRLARRRDRERIKKNPYYGESEFNEPLT